MWKNGVTALKHSACWECSNVSHFIGAMENCVGMQRRMHECKHCISLSSDINAFALCDACAVFGQLVNKLIRYAVRSKSNILSQTIVKNGGCMENIATESAWEFEYIIDSKFCVDSAAIQERLYQRIGIGWHFSTNNFWQIQFIGPGTWKVSEFFRWKNLKASWERFSTV